MSSSTAATKDRSRLCSFYIVGKHRPCSLQRTRGSEFCAIHSSTQGPGTRIPCPIDSSHTVLASKIESHLKKCSTKAKNNAQKPPYFGLDANIDPAQELAPSPVCTEACVVEKVVNLWHHMWDPNFSQSGDGIGLNAMGLRLSQSSHRLISQKHWPQIVSMLAHMENLGAFTPPNAEAHSTTASSAHSCSLVDSFVEYGAGKAHLTRVLSHLVAKETSRFFIVDRKSFRYSAEKYDDLAGFHVTRLKVDIKDLVLHQVEDNSLLNCNKLIVYGKHVCGAATDMTLRSIFAALPKLAFHKIIIVIALCCYHACSWRAYINKPFLVEHELSEQDFSCMCSMSSWYVCGMSHNHQNSAALSPTTTLPPTEETTTLLPPTDSTTCSTQETTGHSGQYSKPQIGLMARQVLLAGRIKALMSHGFSNAHVCQYVSYSVTPENTLLLASL
ncbi:Methyltransferase TRM13 [Pelomyxa schiedti]|nr:Methyltransferase TRM13 [Pelomyxa schiedti]